MSRPKISVIGGTGALGNALVHRFARADYSVVVGSRDAEKAAATAASVQVSVENSDVRGLGNGDAAAEGDVVVVTVPFASQGPILSEIAEVVRGKIVVDTTVPLAPPKVSRVSLPPKGSAALTAKACLGDEVALVTAFHNVSAQKLAKEGATDCDILVFGDDEKARETVVGLVRSLGMRGLHGGPLVNSVAAEALTSVLIAINRRYKVGGGAGIRITGDLSIDRNEA